MPGLMSLEGNSLPFGVCDSYPLAECPKQVSSFDWSADEEKVLCQSQAILQTAVTLGHVMQWIR